MMEKVFIHCVGCVLLLLGVITCGSDTSMGVAWALPAIAAGASVLSSLFGGNAASKAAKKGQRYLDREEADERAWYERSYNQRYLDTAAGQELVRKAMEYANNNTRRAEGIGAVSGGTLASVAKLKEQGNKMVGDTIAQIAASDTANKSAVDRLHRQHRSNIAQQRVGTENLRAQNITAAAGQASNTLMNIAAASMDNRSKTDSFWSELYKKQTGAD